MGAARNTSGPPCRAITIASPSMAPAAPPRTGARAVPVVGEGEGEGEGEERAPVDGRGVAVVVPSRAGRLAGGARVEAGPSRSPSAARTPAKPAS